MTNINGTKFLECTAEEQLILTWQYGLISGFNQALMNVIVLADEVNLEKLAVGFPTHVNGYVMYMRVEGWWEELQRRVVTE